MASLVRLTVWSALISPAASAREPETSEFTIAAGNTAPGRRLQAFVGRLIKIKDAEDLCQGNCWSFDATYEATFEVLERIDGTYAPGERVTFSVFAHTGGPGAAAAPAAVLYVWEHDFGNAMVKYSGEPVFPTRSAQWASCGDPYPKDVPRRQRRLQPQKYDRVAYASLREVVLKTQGAFLEEALVHLPEDCLAGSFANDFAIREVRDIKRRAEAEREN